MSPIINFDHRAKRYSLSPFGNGTVIHCDPCAESGNPGHWAAVRGLSDALAWVEYHEIHHAHADDHDGTPIADSIVPEHEHPAPEQLYGVVTGHARDADVWMFNDRHAARLIARIHSGAVVGLPILNDFRAGAPEQEPDPLAKIERHRQKNGPCSATHPTRGLCIAYAGHFPPVHMSRYGEEWTDVDTGAEPNIGGQGDDLDDVAEMFGQMLADGLGMPVSMMRIERIGRGNLANVADRPGRVTVRTPAGETPFGPDVELPEPGEVSPVDELGDIPGVGFLAAIAQHVPASQLDDRDDEPDDDVSRETSTDRPDPLDEQRPETDRVSVRATP